MLLLAVMLSGCSATVERGPVELTFWHGADPAPNRVVLEKLVAEFNRTHQSIRVKPVYAGLQDQQIPKILAAVIGGSPPDLLWYNSTLTGQLVKTDALVQLDDFPERETLLASVWPNLQPATRYRGHTWSIPFDTNNLAVFYNKQIFARAGVGEPPRTWPEFLALAKRLTTDSNGDGRPEQYGLRLPLGTGEWTVFNWLAFYWAAGGDLIVDNQPQINSPAGRKALGYWAQFLEPPVGASLSQPEQGFNFDDFYRGRVAMQVSGPWVLAEMKETNVEYGVFPLPRGDVLATTIGGEQLFLLKTTRAREQASWEFARYVLSDQFQAAWAAGTGYLPVTKTAARSAQYRAFLKQNPQMQVFLDQLPVGRVRPLDPTYPQVSNVIGQAIEQVLLKARTPEAALADAQQEAQSIIRTQPGAVVE